MAGSALGWTENSWACSSPTPATCPSQPHCATAHHSQAKLWSKKESGCSKRGELIYQQISGCLRLHPKPPAFTVSASMASSAASSSNPQWCFPPQFGGRIRDASTNEVFPNVTEHHHEATSCSSSFPIQHVSHPDLTPNLRLPSSYILSHFLL